MKQQTYKTDPPYFVTHEMAAELQKLFAQSDMDTTQAADAMYQRHPEHTRREWGFAAIWGREEYQNQLN